jgi:ABC-type glycerol-3-phosphate transport system substrate-binding protein
MTADSKITKFKHVIHDSDIDDDEAEDIFDYAIDFLNIYGAGITKMSGTAGSKTVTLTSSQEAAISFIGRAIYASYYKNASNENSGVQSLTLNTATDLMSNQTILSMAKNIASQLRTRSFDRVTT